ncbi:helix-turn-helix domain-containing protein [Brevibacillus parabrevis]|uniref:helix-turn-helix domain-containing protein n=1 Tax=Brevibacillus parabrevis TaxID=54914 RepID=UPI002E1ACEC9|nr:helix-turn-helix domain-containing protein [Brevibacillus parabrevis]
MKPLMTANEVAILLGVHKVSVLRWIKERHLNAIKVGNAFRIEKEALQDFIAKRKLW